MTRIWTIIGVADVAQSFGWYQALLCLPPPRPAHDYFGQIVDVSALTATPMGSLRRPYD